MSKEVIARLKNGEIPFDFNWNKEPHDLSPVPEVIPAEPSAPQINNTTLVAEDLRDGLHGVSKYPSIEKMTHYVNTMAEFGIDTMTVGIFPGTSNGKDNKVGRSIKKVLAEMRESQSHVTPIVLSLATKESLAWTAECKSINPNLQAIVFMGTAPSRMLVQEWSKDSVLEKLGAAVYEATNRYQIDVIGATEHTTQTDPDFLKKIIDVQVSSGAKIFCIADTIGTARPLGTYRIVRFVKDTLAEMGANDVLVDWHGHRDMGNDLSNAMTAISAGADRIHTVARGIGERAGNTQMEAVVLNCARILEENNMKSPYKLSNLSRLLSEYNKLVGVAQANHGPLSKRAFDTSLGIHTDAINKALILSREAYEMGEHDICAKLEGMAKTIYSAFDPITVGSQPQFHVGPWSGKSTVELAASQNFNMDPTTIPNTRKERIIDTARTFGRELSSEELRRLLINGHE